MITRIEIDGFKTFENFSLDLTQFIAIVGPNASGKSNLFDALRFLSALARADIRSAMQDVRGLPEELFRQTAVKSYDQISFAVEVLLEKQGTDDFGSEFHITAQRLRYELKLFLKKDSDGFPRGVFVAEEFCRPIAKKDDRASYLHPLKISYNSQVTPFIRLNQKRDAIEVRQDGRQKHGRPLSLSLSEASRTALSTITTAEFPHLYALREALSSIRFLEINPRAARGSSDRLEDGSLKPDASNLAAALAHLKEESARRDRPNGVLSDIAADLTSLIPSVRNLEVHTDTNRREYSFKLGFSDSLTFSSRVISDGTLRLLALLTLLNDPTRKGSLCFEEPENGVHEGRVPMLIKFLRRAAKIEPEGEQRPFQIILNTHSPKVMAALHDDEIAAADTVSTFDAETRRKSSRTRIRTKFFQMPDLFDPEHNLTRSEIDRLLQHNTDAA
jgi:predicted ATPase